jgi:phosphinothricin acetyltransferase
MTDIRAATESDLDALNDLYNHYVRTSPATFDIDQISMDRRREWFTHYSESGPHRVFVAIEDSELLGYASSSRLMERKAYETSTGVTVYVLAGRHGQGIGKALYQHLFEAIAGEDLHRAYAGITVPNAASFALHRSFGFKQVAYYTEQGRKFDRYWDVAWFEKEL